MTSIKGCNSVKTLGKMTGNNPKLGLVNVDVHTKFGQILSCHSQDIEWKQIVHGMTERQNDVITEGQGESSIAPLFQSGAIIITTGGHMVNDYGSFT